MAPKLWSETIDAHRREMREAILAATLDLLAQHGVRGVTMSQIAERVGVGRATLYKYFPDVEAILVAHHLQHVAGHLARLADLRDAPGTPIQRLEAVCEALLPPRTTRTRHRAACARPPGPARRRSTPALA